MNSVPAAKTARWLSYENLLLAILFLAFGFVFFDRLALSFLFPFISAELRLSHTQLGMLSSVLALMWSLSGAVAGAYSDARGARKQILVVAVIVFSLCSALSGLVGSFVALLVFRALMGVAEGPVLPLSQSLMIESSAPHRRGLNMGLLQGSAAGLLGAVIGPPVVIHFATEYGWRTAFYLSCLPGFVIAALIALFVRERPPRDAGAASAAATGSHAGSRAHGAGDSAREPGAGRANRWQLLKHRNILLCVLISCSFVTWFIVLVSFAPTFLVEARRLTPQQMSGVLSCLGAAWVLWGFAVPAISDRVGRKPAMVLFAAIAALCPIVMMYAQSTWALGAGVLLTYTGLGCFTLFMATIPAETIDRRSVATALGLIMGIGELIGGFFAPTIAGFAAHRFGLPVVMWIAAGGALIACAASFLLVETAPAVLSRRAGLGATGARTTARDHDLGSLS
ncbi:MFS transporter [Burkholderia sp. TSV86]|uniref:MFS transporter n=1 Tax=Burkholderia sp. TSV86 TaxID=1385594 RepID=UPI000758AFAE|nr:MFS transporter [Burkholderia sp. TSV86]KVE35094.1 MFS transporter [Burkholderia sp. TSV86]